jgi:uncharacterized protein YbjT (DUF2867 family)
LGKIGLFSPQGRIGDVRLQRIHVESISQAPGMFKSVILLVVCATAYSAVRTVVVTGATGGTGSLIFKQLKQTPGVEVRGLVTNLDKAKKVLNCSACDASEGIYLGDVTNKSSLMELMKGADSLAIAVGLSGSNTSAALMQAVEWKGVENQVAALVGANSKKSANSYFVAFISSMGTTSPNPPPYQGGPDLFWKLQGESFLQSSGVGYTIVKPCGLVEGAAQTKTLLVGHDDTILGPLYHSIPRADVAQVMVAATMSRETSAGLRFDLCSKPGKKTTDYTALLQAARWAWE